ncbi:MAG: helix-turn-helix domain-containing protein [Gemmatimonadota bacterium]|nr:helix-turn-helix domain-containing protein [Gemmatimonadota bacterium]
MSTATYPIPEYTIKPLQSGLKALQLIQDSMHPMSTKEVAERIGEPQSQAYRILYTLEVEGYIERDERGLWAIHSDIYLDMRVIPTESESLATG